MATLNFDARTVEPSAPMGIVPEADYNLQIVKSEIKPTNSGDGHYLELVFEVLDGQHKGSKVWKILNKWNPNETTVRIADAELSAIAHAVGELVVPDSEILHHKPLTARVTIKKSNNPQYPDDKNDVKNFRPYKGAATPAPASAPAPAFAPQAPAAQAPAFAAPVAPAAPPPFAAPAAAPAPAFAPAPAPVAPAAPPPFAAPAAPSPFGAPAFGAAPGQPPVQPWGVKS